MTGRGYGWRLLLGWVLAAAFAGVVILYPESLDDPAPMTSPTGTAPPTQPQPTKPNLTTTDPSPAPPAPNPSERQKDRSPDTQTIEAWEQRVQRHRDAEGDTAVQRDAAVALARFLLSHPQLLEMSRLNRAIEMLRAGNPDANPANGENPGLWVELWLTRAVERWRVRDERFAELVERTRGSIGGDYLLAWTLGSGASTIGRAIASDPDVIAATDLWRERVAHDPEAASPLAWELLRRSDPPVAAEVASRLVTQDQTDPDTDLDPASDKRTEAEQVLADSWLAEIEGDYDRANRLRDDARARGLGLP